MKTLLWNTQTIMLCHKLMVSTGRMDWKHQQMKEKGLKLLQVSAWHFTKLSSFKRLTNWTCVVVVNSCERAWNDWLWFFSCSTVLKIIILMKCLPNWLGFSLLGLRKLVFSIYLLAVAKCSVAQQTIEKHKVNLQFGSFFFFVS